MIELRDFRTENTRVFEEERMSFVSLLGGSHGLPLKAFEEELERELVSADSGGGAGHQAQPAAVVRRGNGGVHGDGSGVRPESDVQR